MMTQRQLPPASSVLVVCAHPDDESFGLGGLITAFRRQGARVDVICFTHGEASTLGDHHPDLRAIRSSEFRCATSALGIESADLLDYPDGRLSEVPLVELVAHIDRHGTRPDLILAFDDMGVSGHSDHRQATRAATTWARRHDTAVLAWAIHRHIAEVLNTTFGSTFSGRDPEEIEVTVTVDRADQIEAIRCHESQAVDNPVLWRRLELQGDREFLRWIHRPTTG